MACHIDLEPWQAKTSNKGRSSIEGCEKPDNSARSNQRFISIAHMKDEGKPLFTARDRRADRAPNFNELSNNRLLCNCQVTHLHRRITLKLERFNII